MNKRWRTRKGWRTRRLPDHAQQTERLQERLSEQLEEHLELLEEGGIEIETPPRLRQFLVIAKYKNAKGKERARIDFLVNDYSESEALASTKIFLETVLAKRDNWEWILGVPWDYALEREYETIENPDARPRRKSVEVN